MLWRRFAGARLIGALLRNVVTAISGGLLAENSDQLQTESGDDIYTEGN